MNIKDMTTEALETRKAEIAKEAASEGVNKEKAEALLEELRGINAELETRKAEAKAKEELRAAVAQGAGEVKVEVKKEDRKMPDIEVRNTKAYIDAYANYIKTGDDKECRALLTENATDGTVPIPELVYEETKTAWNKNGITALVKKTFIKGNLKVGFEISGTDAVVHTEGSAGVAEETLVLGTVNLVPESIKKWISISDEALDLRGEAFLRYVYSELAYRIAKKAGENLLDEIIACGTVGTSTQVGVPVYTSTTASLDLVSQAVARLSDEAANPVIIMNKLTKPEFDAAMAKANYKVNAFGDLPVVYSNHLKALSAATTGETWVIVGDLGFGSIANFPNGEEITFKFDDVTLATSDLVKVIGRQFVAVQPVACDAFCKVVK